jgi:uncharacterized protein (TIGR00369 family)
MTRPVDMMRQLAPQVLMASPHAAAVGMEMVSIDPAEAVLRVRFRPDLVGDPDTGVIAGGVVTALLDHTCGQSVMAALDSYQPIATLDLRIDYMRPAGPGLDIFCHAHCYKVTRSVAFVRAQAYDVDREDPVATAQAAFMLNANSAMSPAETVLRAMGHTPPAPGGGVKA